MEALKSIERQIRRYGSLNYFHLEVLKENRSLFSKEDYKAELAIVNYRIEEEEKVKKRELEKEAFKTAYKRKHKFIAYTSVENEYIVRVLSHLKDDDLTRKGIQKYINRMARKLGRTPKSIREKIHRMKGYSNLICKEWTEKEDKIILDNYTPYLPAGPKRKMYANIRKLIPGRTTKAISVRIRSLANGKAIRKRSKKNK